MGDFLMTVKILVFSFVLLGLMQIKTNGVTLEKQALIKLHQSKVGQTIEDVSMGASKILKESYQWAQTQVGLKPHRTSQTAEASIE